MSFNTFGTVECYIFPCAKYNSITFCDVDEINADTNKMLKHLQAHPPVVLQYQQKSSVKTIECTNIFTSEFTNIYVFLAPLSDIMIGPTP